MLATERRINTAQLFTVIFILGMSMKMLMLPVLLLKAIGRDSVLGVSAILLLELICLGVCIAAIVLAPEKSFTELLQGCVGKIASRILLALFAVYFLFKLLLLSGEVRIFFCENLFGEFPWTLYSLPFFGLCICMGMGSLRALGRSAQFLFPFIVVATIVMFVLIASGIDFREVFPIGEFGFANVSRGTLRYAMWYGDYSALVVCLGAVKRTRKTAALSMTAGVISSLAVLFYMFGLTASFSNICFLIRYGQNVTGMSHYAMGNIMQGRFDLVLFCVWMMSVFVKAGIFSYAAVYCIRAVAPVGSAPTALGVGIALYIATLFVPSAIGLHVFMTEYMFVPALIFQFGTPALTLSVALMARRGMASGTLHKR
ncbi:MAG: spore germination protein, partial [Clostridiales bacterium]|nr:spore germination protein [Clostridiales bacterium]